MTASKSDWKYVYGPVASWRLGSSLGIDPISQKGKVCSFDCVYCQLGRTRKFENKRKVYVPTGRLIQEIKELPVLTLDYITFSGAGEPTLAKNLGAMIRAVKRNRSEKIAVITNSSLMTRGDVQADLSLADLVVAKLDADSESLFRKMNRPMPAIHLKKIVQAMKIFRKTYKGKLALQIMFTGINRKHAGEIAQIAAEIRPDEIEINTPLRHCAIQPLPPEDIQRINAYFKRLCGKSVSIVSVYRAQKKKVKSVSAANTLKRRGK